jgi:restriction system protein
MEKICNNCGKTAKSNADFCTNCGCSLETAPQKESIKSTSVFHETVILETLDGLEFEKLCAKIFQKLNYGTVELMPYVGDGGRDLMIHSPEGLIVVECKHQPHTSIGRPVVQKLHSALISSNAIKGILVTSGKFSIQAVEHANTLSPKIEMVDKKILADLATRSGIELILEGKRHTVLRYPLSEINEVRNKIYSFIDSKCESNSGKPSDTLAISQRNVAFLPSYMIQYDINSIFETNVGVIHKENLEDGVFLVDGKSGALLKQELANHLYSATLSVYNESDFSQVQFSRSDFVIDDRTLANLSKKIIIDRHTKTVSYYGRNNQHYSKVCIPGEKDIFISNIKQVYIPYQDINFKILTQNYGLKGVENTQKMLIYTTMLNCKVCGTYISSKGLFCNSCGGMVHSPRLLDSHGFKCKICGKTICRNCSYDLGISKKVCKDCAEKSGKPLITVSKNMHQRQIVGGGCFMFGLASYSIHFLLFLLFFIAGIGILLSDYRTKAPPFEII